ncbi:MAG: 3-oxoacyl-ACP reductase FabG [Desulfarculales bacterium]|jgi:3-oxoacyl-[acyl-carrier protein] reductase|nr:3-oxoacyl-ACP reductase FabG [Desulfarculales bacterium]
MLLKDKVCVLTGAANGLGQGTAFKFAREGAIVIVADIDSHGAAATVEKITAQGGRALSIDTDVRKRDDVDNLFAQVMDIYGRVDVLLNNAGVLDDAMLTKMTDEQFDNLMGVNLKGAFMCARAAALIMTKQGSGSIINCSSIAGIYGNFGQTAYAASKAALIGMMHCWARELGPKGIRVNAVAPGPMATIMMERVKEEARQALINKISMKRFGNIEELANVYTFLASDESSYVSGAVLEVSGDSNW